jgi:Fur family ferric uptake transcriptional regulator
LKNNKTQREILTSEEFKALLKKRGLKVTTQRLAVLETLGINPDAHLTVEEIYDLVKKSNPEIGLATIYRTVQVLKELQLIDRVNFDDGVERYELVHLSKDGSQKHHHHHLICVNCGRVFEFEEDMMESLELKIAKETGFKVIDHEVKLYGYCKECGGKPIE